ncbi:hypothetical protein L5876_02245 [Hyphobacterium sp. SN044]|uniref:hypothetical protein n=1 Tax=Hyphobacterium sp. SN044 TaxID=2912575 RepID=UPI001F3A16FD|nr:hypothetical protein [Hyphobacterium sp. SN044]MCF8878628.1 hypothetical protein [Hyphobacterium sp. SN044]
MSSIDDERTTAIGLFNFAESYRICADSLTNSRPSGLRFEQPIQFLYWHALELFLKAFLRAKGVGIAELKSRYGHNLKKLQAEAINRGFIKLELAAWLIENWQPMDIFETRYIRTGAAQIPHLEDLALAVVELKRTIEPIVMRGQP